MKLPVGDACQKEVFNSGLLPERKVRKDFLGGVTRRHLDEEVD